MLYNQEIRLLYKSANIVRIVKARRMHFGWVFCLFNDAVSNSGYIASNDWMVVNNELKSVWKEMVVVLSRDLLGVVEKNDRVVQCTGRDSNRAPLSYNSEALLCELTCSLFV
jgi:hypothetical protein